MIFDIHDGSLLEPNFHKHHPILVASPEGITRTLSADVQNQLESVWNSGGGGGASSSSSRPVILSVADLEGKFGSRPMPKLVFQSFFFFSPGIVRFCSSFPPLL